MTEWLNWKGRRVLITGHTGFKGSWLCYWLSTLGARVAGYARNSNTMPSLFDAAELSSCCEHNVGDVQDLDSLLAVFTRFKPEIVFHLAAQSLVREGYRNPIETYSTNLMGTVNILECARRVGGVKGIVVVTSDKCYQNQEWHWGYREDDRLS